MAGAARAHIHAPIRRCAADAYGPAGMANPGCAIGMEYPGCASGPALGLPAPGLGDLKLDWGAGEISLPEEDTRKVCGTATSAAASCSSMPRVMSGCMA